MENLTEFLILLGVIFVVIFICCIVDGHTDNNTENDIYDQSKIYTGYKVNGYITKTLVVGDREPLVIIFKDGKISKASDLLFDSDLDYFLKSDDLTDLEKEEIKKAYKYKK